MKKKLQPNLFLGYGLESYDLKNKTSKQRRKIKKSLTRLANMRVEYEKECRTQSHKK